MTDEDILALQIAIEGRPITDFAGNVINHRGGLKGDINGVKEDVAAVKADVKAVKIELGQLKINQAMILEQNGKKVRISLPWQVWVAIITTAGTLVGTLIAVAANSGGA